MRIFLENAEPMQITWLGLKLFKENFGRGLRWDWEYSFADQLPVEGIYVIFRDPEDATWFLLNWRENNEYD